MSVSMRLLLSVFLVGLVHYTNAQSTNNDSLKIIIENADLQEFYVNENPPIQKLIGNVRAFHKGTFFYADSIIIQGQKMKAGGNVVMIKNDTSSIFSDSLTYDGEAAKVHFYGDVVLENGRNKLFSNDLEYFLKSEEAVYKNKAELHVDSIIIRSKIGSFNNATSEASFYKNVSVDGQDFRLINDTLFYNTKDKRTSWSCPTLIKSDQSTIYSEAGYYYLESGDGEFTKNPRFTEDETVGIADTIQVKDKNNIVTLKGHAQYTTSADSASADVIIKNKNTDQSQLIGNAYYASNENETRGEEIIFNDETSEYFIEGKGFIADPPMLIYGNHIAYNQNQKKGTIVGDVLWKDTAANSEIYCDSLIYKGKENYSKAIGKTLRPLLISYGEDDTMYMSADTLLNIEKTRQIDSILIDTFTYLIGDNDVRIYNRNYQAKSDSIVYHKEDSTFTLLGRPLLWQDTMQLSGDTIFMHLAQNKLKHLQLAANAFTIQSQDLVFFNQIKGRQTDIYFNGDEIEQMKVNGNAQSIQYLLDDEDAYIGVNVTDCGFIIFEFMEGEIHSVRHYNSPESKILPMEGTNHEAIKLEGYNWSPQVRPKSAVDVR